MKHFRQCTAVLNRWLPIGVCALLLLGSSCLVAQQGNPPHPFDYESHNQIDPRPLKLHSISGVAIDDAGALIPAVIIGLFSEPDHKLIATTETDSRGEFALAHISPGKYRLVAKFVVFCPANVPIEVEGKSVWALGRSLKLHMRGVGIDTCSFGSLK